MYFFLFRIEIMSSLFDNSEESASENTPTIEKRKTVLGSPDIF